MIFSSVYLNARLVLIFLFNVNMHLRILDDIIVFLYSLKDSVLNSSRGNLTSSIGNLSRHPQELAISLESSRMDSFAKDLPTPTSTPTTSR